MFVSIVRPVTTTLSPHTFLIISSREYIRLRCVRKKSRVRKGDKVEGGQLIGTVFSDPSDGNRTKLHFEVRHEKTKLDPMLWLKP